MSIEHRAKGIESTPIFFKGDKADLGEGAFKE